MTYLNLLKEEKILRENYLKYEEKRHLLILEINSLFLEKPEAMDKIQEFIKAIKNK